MTLQPMQAMGETSLQVKNLSKNFPRQKGFLEIINNVSFSVKAGEVLAILGRSGSGKTTLLNIISNLEEPSSGEVVYSGAVSYTPQKDLLLPWRTVRTNVSLPNEIKYLDSKETSKKVDDLMNSMELAEFKDTYPSELSGGMRQKVSLARSLTQNVPLYLFDEALSAVDFDTRLALAKSIRSYILEGNKIAIFVTHNIEEAISIADKIIVLSPRPARIIYETAVTISEELRDPVAIRKNLEFQKLFETLWHTMERK